MVEKPEAKQMEEEEEEEAGMVRFSTYVHNFIQNHNHNQDYYQTFTYAQSIEILVLFCNWCSCLFHAAYILFSTTCVHLEQTR